MTMSEHSKDNVVLNENVSASNTRAQHFATENTTSRHSLMSSCFLSRLVIITSVLTCSAPVIAESSDTDSNSQALLRFFKQVQNKQFDEAFITSETLIEEHGGDPQFDYLLGQAAYYSQRYQEAVFAFERVMFTQPDHIRARLLLAFSYYKVKNYGAASVELNWLLNHSKSLSESEVAQITRYLQHIKEVEQNALSSNTFSVSVGLGHDTNVNSGTENDSVFLPALGRNLDLVTGTKAADNIVDVNLAYRHIKRLSQQSFYSLQASLSHLTHDTESQLDRSYISLVANYSDQWHNTKYNVSGYIQPMTLDGDYYRAAYGIIVDGTWKIADNWFWKLATNIAQIDNKEFVAQSLEQLGLSTTISYQSDLRHALELRYNDDDATENNGEHFGKEVYSAAYTLLYPYSNTTLFSFRISADKADYAAIHPIYLVIREDESVGASITAQRQFDEHWRIAALVRHTNKSSNISIYEYDRSEFKITTTYRF